MFIGGKTLFAALIILVFALIGILVRVLRDRVVAKRAREHMELERLRNANKAPEFPSGIMDDISALKRKIAEDEKEISELKHKPNEQHVHYEVVQDSVIHSVDRSDHRKIVRGGTGNGKSKKNKKTRKR